MKNVYQVINTQLMSVKNKADIDKGKFVYGKIVPNIFEAGKAWCVGVAKNEFEKICPKAPVVMDFDREELPDLEKWMMAFSCHQLRNEKPVFVKFDARLEEYLKSVDFSLPYDDALAWSILEHFIVDSYEEYLRLIEIEGSK